MSSKLEEAKAMNKAKFDRQVEERAKAIASELKKLFKTQSEKLPPTYKGIQMRATPIAPPLWLIFIKKFKIKSVYHSAAPRETLKTPQEGVRRNL